MKRLVLAVSIATMAVGCSSGAAPTAAPAQTPSPTLALLARGNFHLGGHLSDRQIELEAAGSGPNVTGSMHTADGTEIYDVDLECSKTTESGLLMVGGNVINSTTEYAPEDTWAGIVLKPGSPAEGTIVLQLDDPKMPTCLEFLDQMISFGEPPLEQIEGTVELGP